ncbi:MAG: DAK2 domain-containing protein [Chloroflexota bacterium]|nr:DAK2 domain-containing protein [Chloroflexota bacterium]MDE2948338.1 DAK2 domain-containing protein [Chloroflexota bacterium]
MATSSIDGRQLKRRFRAGVDRLSQHVELINQLNVFPVPDGDTGINMFHTLRRAYEEIAEDDSEDAGVIADRFAHGALMGARGNSGTILSQLLKGFADGLQAPTLRPSLLRRACQAAVKQAYSSLSKPTEGTMLTVAREAAESLGHEASGAASLKQMLEGMTAAALASLENTPNLLPILKEAGVVDAGGMGLVCFMQGMLGGQSALPAARLESARELRGEAAGGSYGYDVQFLMIGEDLDIARARRDLEALGWSVIVAGDRRAIKVHIHVNNPALPLDYALKTGAALDDIVVENMDIQYQRGLARRQNEAAPANSDSPATSVIAVVEGDGMRAVFRDLNCDTIIDGGAGRNPSTEDFLVAIKQLPSHQVVILPNDRNIVLAAQQAADLIEGRLTRVLPTESVLQGISAMLAYGDASDANADLEATIEQMSAARAATISIEVTRASRMASFRGLQIRRNDYIALVDGELCSASADIESAVLGAFSELDLQKIELATIYFGADLAEADAAELVERLKASSVELEFEIIFGGQTLYPYLISVE